MRVLTLVFLSLVIFASDAFAKDILIFGATRNTGLETAKILVARGDNVTAFVRENSDLDALQALGVPLVYGDALDADSVKAAFAGQAFEAVVTTLGGGVRNTEVDSIGNGNVFAAAEKAGVKRLVMVTAIGAGGTENVLQEGARNFLKPSLDAKTIAENALKVSGLEWTILRPGQLPDGPATGNGLLSEDHTTMGRISRSELAALIVKCLDDPATVGKIYHAVDADMMGSFSSFD